MFFILLHHAFKLDITISFDTGSDNTRRLLIVIHIVNNDGSSALHFCLFAHSRVGKIKPIKLSQKTVRFQDVNKLDVWHISDDMVIDLEEFTCAIYGIYGKSRQKSVHDLRYSILK